MKDKKLKFTIAGGVILICVLMAYFVFAFVNKVIEAAIIIAWLSSFNIWFGVYCYSNVKVKKIISEHYNSNLDDKFNLGGR